MIWKYPQEVHDFVRENCTKMRDADLAEACNKELGTDFTKKKMRAFRYNHRYFNGLGKLTHEEVMARHYPEGMYEFVRDNSWGVSSQKMAEMVNEKYGTNFTKTMMKQFRQRHKIKSGETGWFQKGHPPGNKGKKLEEYITDPERLADIRKRISATQFKKGDRPINEMPVGTIVVNSDGYKLRKKQMEGAQWERWEFLHKAVWEEHNGPIPNGMLVSFKDSNKLNCDINNLILITRGENAALTRLGLRSEDPEMTEVGLAIVRLKQTANKRRNKNEKSDLHL